MNDGPIAVVVPLYDFRDEELNDLLDIFLQNGLSHQVVASVAGECVGIQGTRVDATYSFEQADAAQYSCVALIGGPGTEAYLHNDSLHDFARFFVEQNKIVAAICWAPAILANAGLLMKKNATVWVGAKNDLLTHGANYTGADVTVDGNFLTADGPDSTIKFANTLVSMLIK